MVKVSDCEVQGFKNDDIFMWPNWKRERSQSFRRIGFVPLASWISVSRRYAYFHKPIFEYCPHACVYNSEWFEQNLVKVFSWSVKTQKQHHSRTALGRKRTHGEKDNGEVQCSIKWECNWFRALDAKLCLSNSQAMHALETLHVMRNIFVEFWYTTVCIYFAGV
jgi:hypothetical protein